MLAFRSFMTGFLAAVPGAALACDLALALAVDVSGSVDSKEYRLQMDGLAAGLRDPIVSEALVRAQAQVMLVHWSGSTRQVTSIPWTQIAGFDDLENLAGTIETSPRPWRNFSTAVGEALLHTGAAFARVPDCRRRVIDVSGDGPSNEGVAPAEVRNRLREWGITVNAIAIEATEPELTAWFFENVIRGEGAFVITASDFQDYPSKIRRKLLREVVEQTAGLKEADCADAGCTREIH
jgi:Ca-activated chloride channel family protein